METPNSYPDDDNQILADDNCQEMAVQDYPSEKGSLDERLNCPHCGTYFSEEPVHLLNHYAACCVTSLFVVLCLGCIALALLCVLLATMGGGKCEGLARIFGNCRCTPGTCVGCNAGLLCHGTRCDMCSRAACGCCYSHYLMCSSCKTMMHVGRK